MRMWRVRTLRVLLGTCIAMTASFVASGQSDDEEDGLLEELGGEEDEAEVERGSGGNLGTLVGDEGGGDAPQGVKGRPVAEEDVDPSKLDRIKSVQPKMSLKQRRFEVAPAFALSLNDPFYSHYVAQGQALFFPHDAFGVGMSGGYFLGSPDTYAQEVVRRSESSILALVTLPEHWLFGEMQWVPMYGKVAAFNKAIVHYDIFVNAGAGVVRTSTDRLAATVGVGQRWIVGDGVNLRVELRDVIFNDVVSVDGVNRSQIQNYLMLQVGLGFMLPPSFQRRGPA